MVVERECMMGPTPCEGRMEEGGGRARWCFCPRLDVRSMLVERTGARQNGLPASQLALSLGAPSGSVTARAPNPSFFGTSRERPTCSHVLVAAAHATSRDRPFMPLAFSLLMGTRLGISASIRPYKCNAVFI